MAAPSSCPADSRLQRLLAEALDEAEQAALVAHLEGCPACRARLDELAGASAALLQAARRLQETTFVEEAPLRRVLEEVGRNESRATLCHRDGEEWQPGQFPPPPALQMLGELEDYEVCQVLGQGGMGQVFKAYEKSLKRWVAIKVLAPALASEPRSHLRFAQEAQAAAAVRHENVVTIHAVRASKGFPYFVMEYIDGGSLQDYLDQEPTPDWRTIARLGMEIASGLAAAHARGLIHRDIKPANILLQTDGGPEGPGSARITDFGLARIADESRLTDTGLIVGTPMYMAPEQVMGEALDTRVDLFSLGSVLYVLCTGREPFPGGSPMAIIRQVCETPPRPIRDVNPSIPPWLAAIVERLHAKHRQDRFPSAAEVAALLRHGLEHPEQPPVVPSPPRKGSSNRARLRLLTATAILLLGMLTLAVVLAFRAGRSSPEGSPQGAVPMRALLQGHSEPLWSLAFSPDGQTLATGSGDTTIRLWNTATGQEEGALRGHSSAIFAVAFAHSGLLLSSSGDGTIRLWDMAQRKMLQAISHQGGNGRRVAISPDDRTVALGNNNQGIDLWELGTARKRRSLPGDHGTLLALAFSRDGKILATADARGRILFWDLLTGSEIAGVQGDPLGVRALAFSPDRQTLASAGTGDRSVKFWDVKTHELKALLAGLESVPVNLAFSPDGTLLACGTRDGAVQIWDVASGQLLATLPAHQGAAWALAFSPDSHTLATGGEDRLGKLWDLTTGLRPAPTQED
jgi:serine/threonine protein kinase